MSRRVRSAACALVVLLVAILSHPVAADDTDQPVDYRPSLLKDEWYSEGWDQLFYFKDGTFLSVQVSVVNIGFGSRHAAVLGVLVTPDSETFVLKQSRSRGEWIFANDNLNLEIARHRFSGVFPDYEIRLRKREGEMDVDFTVDAEPWRIGKTRQIDEDYRYISFYAPLLSARGRYRLTTGDDLKSIPWTELKGGRGFARRYVNSIALYDIIRSATHVVPVGDSPVQPVIYISRGVDGDIQSNVALFENGRLIRQERGFDIRVNSRLERVAEDDRDIPGSFYLDAEREGFSLKGTIEVNELILRFDPVDQLKPFVRRLVKILNTPIQYRYLADYDLVYQNKGVELRLQGKALMDHIVMRHARSEKPASRHTR